MKRRTVIKQLAFALSVTPFMSFSGKINKNTNIKTNTKMKQRINVLTIGVNDLKKSLKFYRDGLGLKMDGIVGEEFENVAVVFFLK